jgi:hypothetical protein
MFLEKIFLEDLNLKVLLLLLFQDLIVLVLEGRGLFMASLIFRKISSYSPEIMV